MSRTGPGTPAPLIGPESVACPVGRLTSSSQRRWSRSGEYEAGLRRRGAAVASAPAPPRRAAGLRRDSVRGCSCSSKVGTPAARAARSPPGGAARSPPLPGVVVLRGPTFDEKRHHFLWRFYRAAAGPGWHGRVRSAAGTAGCSSSGSRGTPPMSSGAGPTRDRRVRADVGARGADPRQALAAHQRRGAAPPAVPLPRGRSARAVEADGGGLAQPGSNRGTTARRRAVPRTDHPSAPWDLIAAEDKRFARVTALQTVIAPRRGGHALHGMPVRASRKRPPRHRHRGLRSRPPAPSAQGPLLSSISHVLVQRVPRDAACCVARRPALLDDSGAVGGPAEDLEDRLAVLGHGDRIAEGGGLPAQAQLPGVGRLGLEHVGGDGVAIRPPPRRALAEGGGRDRRLRRRGPATTRRRARPGGWRPPSSAARRPPPPRRRARRSRSPSSPPRARPRPPAPAPWPGSGGPRRRRRSCSVGHMRAASPARHPRSSRTGTSRATPASRRSSGGHRSRCRRQMSTSSAAVVGRSPASAGGEDGGWFVPRRAGGPRGRPR